MDRVERFLHLLGDCADEPVAEQDWQLARHDVDLERLPTDKRSDDPFLDFPFAKEVLTTAAIQFDATGNAHLDIDTLANLQQGTPLTSGEIFAMGWLATRRVEREHHVGTVG